MTTPIETIRAAIDAGFGLPMQARDWLAELCDRVDDLEATVREQKCWADVAAVAIRDSVEDMRRAEADRDTAKAGQAGAYAEIGRLQDECLRIAGERDAEIAERDARLDMSPAMLGVVLEAYENGEVDVEHLDTCAVCEAVKTARAFVDRRAHAKASGGEHG